MFNTIFGKFNNNQKWIFFTGWVRNFFFSWSISSSSLNLTYFLVSYLAISYSTAGASWSASFYCCFSNIFFYCFLRFLSKALYFFYFYPKKYSPDIIKMSSFLGSCSGGNGSYSFFYFNFLLFFFFCLIYLNFGKNLSQHSVLSVSSFINYLFIMSSLMW